MLSSGLKYSAMYVSKQGFAVLFEANRLKLGSDGNIETRISNSRQTKKLDRFGGILLTVY
jgi:hypothetical protein